MISQLVQDRTYKDFENVLHYKDKIQEELADMRQFLKQIEEAEASNNNIEIGPSTSHIGRELEASE